MPTIYQSDQYLVRYNRAERDDVTFVTFAPLPAGLDGWFFAEEFFLQRRISAVGIKTASPDWYLGRDIDDALRAVREVCAGRRLIGYGASMGAYAVINYADVLDLHTFVTAGPQFSIDPAKVPFDKRYTMYADNLTFERDRLGTVPPARNGLILYDPEAIDGGHVELIQERHAFETLKVYFSEHHSLAVLQEAGLLGSLVSDVMNGTFDRASAVKALRRRRHASHLVWVFCSRLLQQRGNIEGAFRAVAKARLTPGSGEFEVDYQHAVLLAETGEVERACDLLMKYAAIEYYEERVKYHCWAWRHPAP